MIIGRKVPDDVTFHIRVRDRSVTLIEEHKGNNPYKWEHLTTDDYFGGKRVLIFSLPGAFTPTCSTMQLPGFEEGWFSVQDEAPQLGVQLLELEPGHRVLDACAAPGGKTTHLAETMQDTGKIYAVDSHPGRLLRLKENIIRLGLNIIEPLVLDLAQSKSIEKLLLNTIPDLADIVLLDAPCSALGILRKHPEIGLRPEPKIDELAALQLKLLKNVSRCVKPGGILIYSICSFTQKEGQKNIEHFLHDHKEFSADLSFFNEFSHFYPTHRKSDLSKDGYNLWTHVLGGDSFFVARLKRKT